MILVEADQAAGLAAMHAEAFDRPWDAAAIADLLAAPGVFALMDADANPGGFIMIRVVADEAEVLTLVVSPAARRRGLGRQLADAAAAMAEARGAVSLFLEVAADNAAAVALYAGAGFAPVGRRAGYYDRAPGPGMDALVVKKPLAPPA